MNKISHETEKRILCLQEALLLAELSIALALRLLQLHRDGQQQPLLRLQLWAVVPGVRIFSGLAAHLAFVPPEDRADQLTAPRMAKDVAPVIMGRFPVVAAKFTFAPGMNVFHSRGVRRLRRFG